MTENEKAIATEQGRKLIELGDKMMAAHMDYRRNDSDEALAAYNAACDVYEAYEKSID